jgi:hypothetical protein
MVHINLSCENWDPWISITEGQVMTGREENIAPKEMERKSLHLALLYKLTFLSLKISPAM